MSCGQPCSSASFWPIRASAAHSLVGEHPLGVDDLRLLHDPLAGERVVVGRGLTGDHGLAQPAGGLDDHAVLAAVHRVDGEHDAGLLAVDHLLDDDGHRDVLQRPLLLPVEDGPVGEEGQPALDDVVQHRLEALGVEEGLLLPGVAGAVGVLGAGRRADGDQALRAARTPPRSAPAAAGPRRRGRGRPRCPCGCMASRRASESTAAAKAAEVMTKPGGTGSSSAVMVARLAPLPPVSSTTWQRGR